MQPHDRQYYKNSRRILYLPREFETIPSNCIHIEQIHCNLFITRSLIAPIRLLNGTGRGSHCLNFLWVRSGAHYNSNSTMDHKTSVIMRSQTSRVLSLYKPRMQLQNSILWKKNVINHLFHIAPLHSRDYSRMCWGRHIAHHWHNQSDIQLQIKMKYKKISARFVCLTPSGFFNPQVLIDPIWLSQKYSADSILDLPQIEHCEI